MSARYRLVAIHGFLGRATDWNVLGPLFPDAEMSAVDLWSLLASPDAADWTSVGRALDRALVEAAGRYATDPVFVIGYSFGARLALSSGLLAAPGSPVRGCCLVSCNPGFPEEDKKARATRQASDETWARRILDWPEPEIWRAWDAQPVFEGSRPPAPRQGLPVSRICRYRRFFVRDQSFYHHHRRAAVCA